MIKIISFDMDGTLVDPEFTDWVWLHGIPKLYAEKAGIPFEEAKHTVVEEYLKVGEGSIQWYDIKYWFSLFRLDTSWKDLMHQYTDKIKIFPDVSGILSRLSARGGSALGGKERYSIVLTSNAGREFIDVEMEVTGLIRYFDRIFSATSDFGEVKKTGAFYKKICEILGSRPDEIVHVGDHFEFDYLVPRSLGINAFYLDRSCKHEGEFIISDLRELEGKIKGASL